jgi:hypothetical protein
MVRMTQHDCESRNLRCRWIWFILAGWMVVWGSVGCRSPDPKVPQSASLVSVALSDQTMGDIRETTVAVFKENLFGVAYSGVDNMVFEKRGSWMKDMAYGGWLDSEVWTRVKVEISQYATNRHLLACDAYIVRFKGDSFFEEEQKVYKISKGPYKKMLNTVKERLESK